MVTATGLPPCGRADCPVCGVRDRLLGAGARDWADAVLFDDDTPGGARCEVTIHDDSTCLCQSRLKLDVKGAAYRASDQPNQDSPMCDFAVIAVLPTCHVAAAVEIKLGAATWSPAEDQPRAQIQLQAGLRVLHGEFDSTGSRCTPKAYLAVGKQRHETQEYIDARGVRLSYGSRQVLIEVVDCGSQIDISDGPSVRACDS